MTAVPQPSGEVTLVFSDIEGSTKLLHELGTDAYRDALTEHRRIVREAYAHYRGYEVDYEGDAFFYTFSSASDAVSAVSEAMAGLAGGPIAIRVGIHTGSPGLDPPKYVGMDVHFAARVMSTAHGGQVVVTQQTAELVDAPLVSLGAHRLKDIAEPVTLFQLGDGAFPSLKTIANTNLPTPTSSFLGREHELREADRLLQQTRLLTIHGPGGQGKTRFALELASRARDDRFLDYRDGVFACFLSSLRDPSLVLPTIAQTLSVREQPGQSALEALSAHLQTKMLLLSLDNAEHLLECASELSQLLQACPTLTLLVTSRELLRIQGEEPYALPPLPQDEGAALFCERSRLEPSETIIEICLRLEGLPLAIELAAARTRILSPQQLLERLGSRLDLFKGSRDADPRQQTLRATIEWSYDLLSAEEQTLFARLSVFRGGCTLEAAEEVADADLDSLQSLVDKSLLRFTSERFWMLETIREYAMEQLGRSETDGVRERHTSHFAALAEDAEPHLRRSDRAWLERLESERDNLRAVLDRLEEEGDGDRASILAGAMWRFWYLRSRFREGRQRLERVLALDRGRSTARGKVLHGAVVMAMSSGDLTTAEHLTDEAVELYEALGDVPGTAYSLLLLGNLNAERGDMAAAKPLLAESLRLFLEVGEQDYALVARFNLAWAHAELNDRVRARSLHEENLVWAREIGNERIEASSLAQLAMLALIDGDLQDARIQLRSAIVLAHELGDSLEVAYDLCRFASLASATADHRRSLQLIACADALRQEIGASFEAWAVTLNGETLASCRSNLGDEFAQVWDDGRRLTVDAAIELALNAAEESAS